MRCCDGQLIIIMNKYKINMNMLFRRLVDAYEEIQDGEVNSDVLNELIVNCNGENLKLSSLSSITVNKKSIIIEPHDTSMLSDIENAIYNSGVGLTYHKGPTSIVVKVPKLYDSQKYELVRRAKDLAEVAKIDIKSIQERASRAGVLNKIINTLTKKFIDKIDCAFSYKKDIIMNGSSWK